jgi:hypothetical protein
MMALGMKTMGGSVVAAYPKALTMVTFGAPSI